MTAQAEVLGYQRHIMRLEGHSVPADDPSTTTLTLSLASSTSESTRPTQTLSLASSITESIRPTHTLSLAPPAPVEASTGPVTSGVHTASPAPARSPRGAGAHPCAATATTREQWTCTDPGFGGLLTPDVVDAALVQLQAEHDVHVRQCRVLVDVTGGALAQWVGADVMAALTAAVVAALDSGSQVSWRAVCCRCCCC